LFCGATRKTQDPGNKPNLGHPAEKRRGIESLERKSPRFAGKREGWGTFKYFVLRRDEENPRPTRRGGVWGTRQEEAKEADEAKEVKEKERRKPAAWSGVGEEE